MAADGSRQTIGDYFTLKRGTTYKSALLGQPGPVLLGLATIERNGGFRSKNLKTYGGESPEALIVNPGDLYVSLKDVTQSADLLGAVARLPLDQPPGRLTQDTVRLEPIGDNVPLEYLYWLLRTPRYRSWCRAHATGTTNLGLPRDDFLAFPAPEPTDLQRRLAETLAILDDKIELNRRMSETLEAIARALFRSWFVDFDPVRAKTEGRNTRLPKEISDLFPSAFEESELGEAPKGWIGARLDDWATALSGGTPSKSDPRLWGGNVPWISPKVMTTIHADEADAYVTACALDNGTRLAPAGATLVMVRGMGLHKSVRVSQAREDLAFNQDVKALVPTKIEPSLLLFALLDAQDELLGRVESSGHGTGRLPSDVLLGHPITLPKGSQQRALARPFEDINNRIGLARGEARVLASLRDTLLPRLISGGLSVGDADRLVETAL